MIHSISMPSKPSSRRSAAIAAAKASCVPILGAILFSSGDLGSQPGEGSILGVVSLSGTPPAPAPPTPVKPADATACGREMSDESVVLGSGGSLRWAIAYLESGGAVLPPSKKTAPQPTLKITNHHCRFVPHVQTAMVGSTLLVRNDDDILHNTHAYMDQATTIFNLGLPFKGVEVPKPVRNKGMIRFKCDAGHTWMSAYILVLDHPYHAVTDESGTFRIGSVPPGKHALKIWHERLGTQNLSVQVDAGKESKVIVEFKAP